MTVNIDLGFFFVCLGGFLELSLCGGLATHCVLHNLIYPDHSLPSKHTVPILEMRKERHREGAAKPPGT